MDAAACASLFLAMTPPLPSHLAHTLSRWTGHQELQSRLLAKGLSVPNAWQCRIIEACGSDQANIIHRYWQEIALEYVRSAGTTNSRERKFKVTSAYRSEYLDELASHVDYEAAPFRAPELIYGLHLFQKRLYVDKLFAFELRDYIEKLKTHESECLGLSIEGWSGKKSDAKIIFDQSISALGFRKHKGRHIKESGNGLIFEAWLDASGRPDCAGGLPLYFFVFHAADPTEKLEVSSFDKIQTGFTNYARFFSPSAAVLGIYAHVQMFDIFSDSLSVL